MDSAQKWCSSDYEPREDWDAVGGLPRRRELSTGSEGSMWPLLAGMGVPWRCLGS